MQWKLQYEVQKCINFAGKVASNGRPRDHVTPLLRDLKWVNFNSILQLNEASFMYKNMYISADSNVKKINFDLRNKVSQRITRNGSDVHIDYRRTAVGKKLSQYQGQSCGIRSWWISEIQIPLLRSKSPVPTPPRAPITTWEQPQTFLIKNSTLVSSFIMWRNSIYLKSMLIKSWA